MGVSFDDLFVNPTSNKSEHRSFCQAAHRHLAILTVFSGSRHGRRNDDLAKTSDLHESNVAHVIADELYDPEGLPENSFPNEWNSLEPGKSRSAAHRLAYNHAVNMFAAGRMQQPSI